MTTASEPGAQAMQSTDNDVVIDTMSEVLQNFARLIALCANQIQVATEEADVETTALARAILAMATHTEALGDAVAELSGNSALPPAHRTVSAQADAARAAAQEAFTRLQFADRLHQRLTNVQRNLDLLGDAMRTSVLPISGAAWATLLDQARATFTLEKERDMFDAVFAKVIETPEPSNSPTERLSGERADDFRARNSR